MILARVKAQTFPCLRSKYFGLVLAVSASMKTVIIVSKCNRVTKINLFESWYQFHFKGVCAGVILKKVVLRGRHEFQIKKGEENLMYVQLLKFEDSTLVGTILKAKSLNECWDRS